MSDIEKCCQALGPLSALLLALALAACGDDAPLPPDACTPVLSMDGSIALDDTCDGVDDDCDGEVDEDAALDGAICIQDAGIPDGAPDGSGCLANDTTCDGLDDDCDGAVDEDASGESECGVGACARTGVASCTGGMLTDTCEPVEPTTDLDPECDGIDDDCDGLIDEGCALAHPTCVDLRATCGSVTDMFGDTLDCGECALPETCGASGTANVCGLAMLPPDPVAVVPPAPNGVNRGFLDAFGFFFDTDPPIQMGAMPDDFEPHRVSAIHGRVLDREGDPIAGARIVPIDDPSLGLTFTRADGHFDLLVEGGAQVRLQITRDNYLPVQRRVDLGWESYAVLRDVVLIPQSRTATDLAFDGSAAQTAEGDVVTDSDGTRTAVVVVPVGTLATTFVDGARVPFDGGRFRITEYTVGETGPEAMVAPLPGGTTYTYAADFSFDEVGPLGRVEFSQPISVYLDNFIGFPVGYNVPVGSYDYDDGVWQPDQDGRIIEIVSVTGGLADLNVDTTPGAEGAPELELLGITDEERTLLASRYAVGDTVWRFTTDHFTPKDANMLGRRRNPPDAPERPGEELLAGDCESEAMGSVIRCQSQSLGERVPIAGTPHVLRYQSDRVRGNRIRERTLRFDLSAYELPPGAAGIQVRAEVLGRVIADTLVPPGVASFEVEWDGLDAFGRTWNRPAIATYSVEVDVDSQYLLTDSLVTFGGSFGRLGGTCNPTDPCCVSSSTGALAFNSPRLDLDGDRFRVRSALTKTLGEFSPELLGLGGFFLEDYHAYSPLTNTVFLGNGSTLRPSDARSRSTIVAGRRSDHDRIRETETGAARNTDLDRPKSVAVGPSGHVYFIQSEDEVWRMTPTGDVEPVLVDAVLTPDIWSLWVAEVDGSDLVQVEVDSLGRVYVRSFQPHNRVVRLTEDRFGDWSVERLAGPAPTVASERWQEGDPLDERRLGILYIALGPADTLYLYAERAVRVFGGFNLRNEFIERLDDGTGRARFGEVPPPSFRAFAVGPDGSFYLSGPDRALMRVFPDETTQKLSGNTAWTDWTQLQNQPINTIAFPGGFLDIEVDARGDLYLVVADPRPPATPPTILFRVRDGVLERVPFGGLEAPQILGLGVQSDPIEWGGWADSIDISPDGALYIAETGTERIIRNHPRTSAAIPAGHRVVSPDGSEVYYFSDNGEHLRTVDALTGVILRSFERDTLGRLSTVTDADGEVTRIERPGAMRVEFEAPPGTGRLLCHHGNEPECGWIRRHHCRPGGRDLGL